MQKLLEFLLGKGNSSRKFFLKGDVLTQGLCTRIVKNRDFPRDVHSEGYREREFRMLLLKRVGRLHCSSEIYLAAINSKWRVTWRDGEPKREGEGGV